MSAQEPARGLAEIWAPIDELAKNAGAVRIGSCGLTDAHVEHFRRWLDKGLDAGMSWLRKNLSVRQDPRVRFPRGSSAIVILVPYGAERRQASPDSISEHVARYAQGDDYHDVVDSILRRIEALILSRAPDAWTWRYVDTGPLSDRSLAEQAGLGWIGRNGMLIDPDIGSWHFIGVLLTSLDNDIEIATVADRCGECTACLTACPTEAIRDDRLVDSSRCLSYLTIEHRGAFADDLGLDFAGNIFGCDICQEVCPWNERPADGHPAFETRNAYRNTPVSDLLRMTQEDFSSLFRKSAVKRAKRAGLIRNVLVATEAAGAEDLERLSEEPDERIRAATLNRNRSATRK